MVMVGTMAIMAEGTMVTEATEDTTTEEMEGGGPGDGGRHGPDSWR